MLRVKDYIAAVRENGYPQLRSALWEYDDDNKKVIAACASGQAILNLSKDNQKLKGNLLSAYQTRGQAPDPLSMLFYDTVALNDRLSRNLNLEQIADELEIIYRDRLDEEILNEDYS